MNLNWVFPALISGVLLMLRVIRVDHKIFSGEEISLREYLIGSALTGAGVFLISVSGILAAGLISVYYREGWTTYEMIEVVIFVAIATILAIIGSLWRYFVAGKFRELLYQKLKDKYNK